MTRLRLLAAASLALVLVGSSTRAGKPDGQTTGTPYRLAPQALSGAGADDSVCTIYPLAEMGYDSDLGKWIAEAIPEVIEPGSWKGPGVLRHYAPQNILIVRHSPAVQAKVDGFLKTMRSSLAKGRKSSRAAAAKSARIQAVVPVEHRAPALLHASGAVPEPSSYPVPAPVKPPKHLFHFLIRYEGEGIIDDNVVKFMKVQAQTGKKEKEAIQAPVTAGYATPPASSTMSIPLAAPSPASNASGLNPYSGATSVSTPAPKNSEEKKEKADKKP